MNTKRPMILQRQKGVLVVHLHRFSLPQVTDDGVEAQEHGHEEHLFDLVAEKGVNDAVNIRMLR
jgi:hypothetical protein